MLQEETFFKRRNFLSHEETSCHRKKLPVTGKNFLSQEKTSYHSKQICVKEEQAGTCIGCDVTKDY